MVDLECNKNSVDPGPYLVNLRAKYQQICHPGCIQKSSRVDQGATYRVDTWAIWGLDIDNHRSTIQLPSRDTT